MAVFGRLFIFLASAMLPVTVMITVLILAMFLIGAGAGVSLYAASQAPVGYEDQRGFHHGPGHTESAPAVHGVVPVMSR